MRLIQHAVGLVALTALIVLPNPITATADAYLGVAVQPAGPTLQQQLELPPALGLLVERVAAGSPADRAGIRPHDILLQLNDQQLFVPEQLAGLLRGLSTEIPAALELIRGRERLQIEVSPGTRSSTTLESAPVRVTVMRTSNEVLAPALADFLQGTAQTQPPNATETLQLPAYLGLRLGAVTPALQAHLVPEIAGGAVVLAIAPRSPAESAALEPHDVIIAVNRQPLLQPADLFAQMRNLRPGTVLLLTIIRRGQPLELSARIAPPPSNLPAGFDQTSDTEPPVLPPLAFAADAQWLVVVKTLAASAPPSLESTTLSQPPTLVVQNDDLTIRLEGDPLQRQATITDSGGSILYRGGISSPADRLQMPPIIWARIATLIDPDNLTPRPVPQLESDQFWEWRPSPDWL